MVRSTAAHARPGTGAGARIGHRPIDMVHLAKQTLGDRGLEGEVLRMFDEMSRTYFARIERSTSVDELLRHLHTLKGAAAGIGARAIADLSATAELEFKAGMPVNPERIDDLEMAVQECSAFIGELLGAADRQ